MLKKFILFLCLTASLFAKSGHCSDCNVITYEWLMDCAEKTAYTDHIPHFRRLFNTMKIHGLLECGCGYSTKYFLDNCDKVISIEFMTPGTGDLWYKECLDLYKNCKNWVPLAYNADHKSESFNKACGYQCATHKDYALIDSRYINELYQYFKNLINDSREEGHPIEVAFVDPGVYTRGDMVKVLLALKVPIVLAHDTATDVGSDVSEGLYGWFKVKTPMDYEKIYIPWGQGTTFWIKKDLPYVIDSIKSYRDMIIKNNEDKTLTCYDLKDLADCF